MAVGIDSGVRQERATRRRQRRRAPAVGTQPSRNASICSSGWTMRRSCRCTPTASRSCRSNEKHARSGTCTRRRSPAATSITTSATPTTSRCATSSRRSSRTPTGIDPATLAEIQRYTKLFWLNTGPYNNLTARKFVLKCTPEALCRRRADCREERRDDFRCGRRVARRDARAAAAAVLRRRRRADRHQQDAGRRARTSSTSSANNLYVGVTMKDLEGFEETLPAELARW